MAQQWLVHGSREEQGRLEETVHAVEAGARTVFVEDALALRGLVATMPPASARVALGEGSQVSAVNLGAALVADGHAREVMLVAHRASGSLRSRAARAGIGRVVDDAEVAAALRSVEGGASSDGDGSASPATVRGGGATLGARPVREAGRRAQVPAPAPERALQPAAAPSEDKSPAAPASPQDQEGPWSGASRSAAPAEPGARANVLADRAARHRLSEGEGPAIVLASGRGGVGKSSIAAVMALEAAAWGMDVALLDLDLAFGNLFGFFGLARPCDLTPLSQGWSEEAARAAGHAVAEGVTLYGPCARPEYAETVAPHVERLVALLKRRHDLVIVDGSTTWADSLAQAVQVCDRLALVSDERAGAIGSLARAAELAVRLGVARTRIVRLMNRCDPRRRDEGFMTRANVGLEAARVFRVLEGGFDVGELLGTGHARELCALDDDFTRSCRAAVAKLLADLGRLPSNPEAQRARDLEVVRRAGLFRFAKEAV